MPNTYKNQYAGDFNKMNLEPSYGVPEVYVVSIDIVGLGHKDLRFVNEDTARGYCKLYAACADVILVYLSSGTTGEILEFTKQP